VNVYGRLLLAATVCNEHYSHFHIYGTAGAVAPRRLISEWFGTNRCRVRRARTIALLHISPFPAHAPAVAGHVWYVARVQVIHTGACLPSARVNRLHGNATPRLGTHGKMRRGNVSSGHSAYELPTMRVHRRRVLKTPISGYGRGNIAIHIRAGSKYSPYKYSRLRTYVNDSGAVNIYGSVVYLRRIRKTRNEKHPKRNKTRPTNMFTSVSR